ncbi:hypothetical protein CC86DRAFT_373386 [Ophiobolus disseminans]|uniref:YMC020W-like alpha/beta hydrolase domain-containing protein n=1 Tax=Ophiobolus disseminans TaxID=1469910 RepID=A0A6A6ZMZ2_9PLEO|nr:hypothetical protein CC86DRAFT_373386 [Ophiobolus disseminans]
MNPRKKSKPNNQAPADGISTGPDAAPDAGASTTTTPSDSRTLPNAPSNVSLAESTASSNGATTPSTAGMQTPKGKKWLSGSGSWRSKAPAVAQIAKESIGVSGGATGELPGEEAKKPKDDSPTKFLTKRKSSKGDALPTSITKVNVSSDGLTEDIKDPKPAEAAKDEAEPPILSVDEPPLPPQPTMPASEQAANTWGWRSWWSRPDGYSETGKARSDVQGSIEEAQTTPLPGPTPSEEPDAKTKGLEMAEAAKVDGQAQDAVAKDALVEEAATGSVEAKDTPNAKEAAQTRNTSGSSWFWRWSSAQNAQANPPEPPPSEETRAPKLHEAAAPPESQPPNAQEAQPPTAPETNLSQETATLTTAEGATETASTVRNTSSKPSAWAFWYRGKPEAENASGGGEPQKHVGQVAVYNTPSQSHPEAAQFNEQEQPKTEPNAPKEPPQHPKAESLAKKSFRSLRGRSKPTNKSKDSLVESPTSSKTVTPAKTSPVLEPTRPETAPAAQPAPKLSKIKQEPPNLLLPEFKTTYRLVQQPNFWQQIRQYFLGGEAPMPHLHINPAPPRIKKAVAIGVHGFFPAPIIQKVLGQPTGTSIRFANAAAAAIQDWTEARGYSPEIEQIALEGEGFIAERVNTLWKLLLNWIEHIKQADFILVACHSQGVPVAMMLVAKLIQFGCVNATRIGICAMAGVNMGPFIEYKTKYFGPTAAELFEFSNPKSLVSQMYLAALDEILRFGVRIFYVGSIDDQLVSLESSTFSTLSHPYIYRAVFVDGRIHAPDFLIHLVGFALKLRNLGLPDHGLIRELSPALAGSLYGGEGHSRVYEDPAVYALAVQHALETTSLPIAPVARPGTGGSFKGIQIPIIGEKADVKDLYKLRVRDYEPSATTTNPNPFFLPWAMRGLLEEEFVKKELGTEVEELLGMFEEWRPTGKQLKDVKFRLEGVRSKL